MALVKLVQKPGDPFDLDSIRLCADMRAAAETPSDKPTKRKPRARETEPFVHMSLQDFLAGYDVLGSKGELAVWVFILHRWRITEPEPVAVTNAALSGWGVSRWTKYRAIEKLAAAGLIEVEAGGKASPRVRLLTARR